MKIVDTHTHLFVTEFDADRSEAVARARAAGVVRAYMPCIDMASLPALLEMCRTYPDFCFPMIGLHPTELGEHPAALLDEMESLLRQSSHPFVAVGEVGLDFYWDESRKEEQIEIFERQIGWARQYDLPLAIHSRKAFDELYALMDKYRGSRLRGIFHCFDGTPDEARALLDFPGFYLGIGGVVTYKKSKLPATLKEAVPLQRLVLETDSPYLPPVPHRGGRNESSYIVDTASFLASLYGVDVSEVARITCENANRLFGYHEAAS